MRQLPLPVRLRTSSVFSGFYPGANADVVQCLQQQRFGASPLVFLYGARGTGKTHLLQALCVQAGALGQHAMYLSLPDLQQHGPELLAGSTHGSILCVDDVDVLLDDMTWNRGFFNAQRELEEQRGKLILAASQPPASFHPPLADLASRIMAGTVLRLQSLSDEQQLQALQLHAVQRGLELPEETAHYLLRRLPRDMHALCSFLDELDIASLTAQRKLTVPFVRTVLDGSDV